jgi:hypothetical protein
VAGWVEEHPEGRAGLVRMLGGAEADDGGFGAVEESAVEGGQRQRAGAVDDQTGEASDGYGGQGRDDSGRSASAFRRITTSGQVNNPR